MPILVMKSKCIHDKSHTHSPKVVLTMKSLDISSHFAATTTLQMKSEFFQLPDFTITLCGKPISPTPVTKDLGVFLDQRLSDMLSTYVKLSLVV